MSTYIQFYKKVFIPENQREITIVGNYDTIYKTTAHYLVTPINDMKNFESLTEILIQDMGYENKEVELSYHQLKRILSLLQSYMNNNWMTPSEEEKTNNFIKIANGHLNDDEQFLGDIGILYCLNIN